LIEGKDHIGLGLRQSAGDDGNVVVAMKKRLKTFEERLNRLERSVSDLACQHERLTSFALGVDDGVELLRNRVDDLQEPSKALERSIERFREQTAQSRRERRERLIDA